jgi:hypothetical protein
MAIIHELIEPLLKVGDPIHTDAAQISVGYCIKDADVDTLRNYFENV